MPSSYAHYRFGHEVLKELPGYIRKKIKNYINLYNIGLHGPDILFYYKPFSLNHVNQKGFGMHDEAAIDFFEPAGQTIITMEEPDPYYAYIYGFICHYVLDSECHGYIDKKIEQSGVSHTEIEAEFDRDLMCIDGYDPITHRLTEHIHPTDFHSQIIANFFDGITEQEVKGSLESMKRYNNLLVAPKRIKRWFLYTVMGVSGNYKELHGLIINYKPNKKCKDSTEMLKKLYKNAIYQAVGLITEYEECVMNQCQLHKRYNLTFGSKETDMERADIYSIKQQQISV